MEILPYKDLNRCESCLFKTVICAFLDTEEFAEIQNTTRNCAFKKGEVMLKQGEESRYLVYMTSGIVKFNYQEDNRRNYILTIQKSPSLLGLANIMNEDTNAFSICAIEDCEGCLIDVSLLKKYVFQNQTFLLSILKMSTEMFKDSIFSFIRLAHKHVYGRIADILLYLSEEIYQSKEFRLSLSRQELAEYAGCSKENVIHTLRGMDSDGIIRVTTKNVEILDYERLQSISKLG